MKTTTMVLTSALLATGWVRAADLSLNGVQTPRTSDPVYDNYFKQSADEFTVEVAGKDRDNPVTVIELTLDRPVEDGLVIGAARAPKSYVSEHGAVLSADATLEISSRSGWDDEKSHARLFSGDKPDYAFHTDKEKNLVNCCSSASRCSE